MRGGGSDGLCSCLCELGPWKGTPGRGVRDDRKLNAWLAGRMEGFGEFSVESATRRLKPLRPTRKGQFVIDSEPTSRPLLYRRS
jgi:hypothetical protein